MKISIYGETDTKRLDLMVKEINHYKAVILHELNTLEQCGCNRRVKMESATLRGNTIQYKVHVVRHFRRLFISQIELMLPDCVSLKQIVSEDMQQQLMIATGRHVTAIADIDGLFINVDRMG